MRSAHDSQVGDLASKIKISEGTTPWQLVPAWLAFFMGLGEKVALAHEYGQRVAVVAVPPVRCFAAAAAAASAVVAVAREAEAVPDVEEHFSALAQLPLGTALVVKMGAKIYAAKFAGVIDRGGEPVIHVEYKGMTHLIPKQQCQRIQVGSGGKKTLPSRSPRSVQSDFRSIAAIIGRTVAAQFVSVPTVDVVLVGHVALLSQELTAVMVRAVSTSVDAGVTLAGLFRAARFLPGSRSYLAEISR